MALAMRHKDKLAAMTGSKLPKQTCIQCAKPYRPLSVTSHTCSGKCASEYLTAREQQRQRGERGQ